MALLTADEFKTLNIAASATEITPAMIEDCLTTAKDELINLCGESVVTEVENATGEPDLKVRRFRKAQDKLAFRELLDKISSRFRSGGVEVRESGNGLTTHEFEKFADSEKRRERLYNEAVDLVTSYLIVEETTIEDEPDESTDVPIQFV